MQRFTASRRSAANQLRARWADPRVCRICGDLGILALALVLIPALNATTPPPVVTPASNPWEDSINRIRDLFTGTIARAVSAIAVVVGGLMFAFGEPGAKKLLAGLVMGIGMAMGAVNLVNWLGT